MLNTLISTICGRVKDSGVDAYLLRAGGSTFVVRSLAIAAGFSVNVLLARLLGAENYGVYVQVLAIIALLSLIVKGGLDTSIVRLVSSYRVRKQWGLINGLVRSSVAYILISSSAVVALSMFLLYAIGTSDHQNDVKLYALYVGFALLPVVSLIAVSSAVLRALKNVVLGLLPSSIIQPALLVVMALSIYALNDRYLSAPYAMIANLVGAVFALVTVVLWTSRTIPSQVLESNPEFERLRWLHVSLPMMLMSGMGLVLNKTDLIMIGSFLTDRDAGIYAAAVTLSGLSAFALATINIVMAPVISELHSEKKVKELQRVVTITARVIFVFTVVITILIAVLGDFLLGLFGDTFKLGHSVLLILLIGQCVNAIAGSVGVLMTMTGHQKAAALIMGGAAILNVASNFFVIPFFGIEGAATVTAITIVLWNLAMCIYVQFRVGVRSTFIG